MADTDDWVDLTDMDTKSLNNCATVITSSASANITSETKTTSFCDTVDIDAYNAFVSETANPAPVFTACGVCYVLRYPNSFGFEAKSIAKSQYQCNACTSRAGIYCRDLGPAGPAFFHNLKVLAAPCVEVEQLRAIAMKTCAQDIAKPELVVVTNSTYAPVQEGCSSSGKPYYHWTVTPSEVTEPSIAARFERLKSYYGQMDTRLAKLTVPEAVASVAIMIEEQSALERPHHYKSVLRWVSQIQALACSTTEGGCTTGAGSFEDMSVADQAKLRVLAIMHGRVDGAVHLDFHQSDNIVDFLSSKRSPQPTALLPVSS